MQNSCSDCSQSDYRLEVSRKIEIQVEPFQATSQNDDEIWESLFVESVNATVNVN
jgi:hypothetical protein